MKERLIIKNFGPIKDVELELGRFNILIGEQATGKSTVAKLLAVCRYFSYIVDGEGTFLSPLENAFLTGLNAWGLNESVKESSYIKYECKHYTLIVQHKGLTVPEQDEEGKQSTHEEVFFVPELKNYSSEFKNLLNELEKLKPKSSFGEYGFVDLFWTIPTSFFQNDVAAVVDNPFYIPAERSLQSIFSLGRNSIQNLSDALFNQLAELDGIARKFTSETSIEPVNIVYKNVNGRGYIRKKDEEIFYSLFNAATGYQSIIPIILVSKYYNTVRRKRKTFIIEEPELNLFPKAQKKLMEYLVDGIMNNGNSILLTTHSPYTLTSLNNLLYAFEVGSVHEQSVSEVLDKKYWLNSEEVSAYKLNSDGTCEDIFDREENMLKAEVIDNVSREINADFDTMMDIKLGIKEAMVDGNP